MNRNMIKRFFPAVFLLILLAGTVAAYIKNRNDVIKNSVKIL